MPCVRGQVAQRQDPASATEREARRAVHAEEVKEDGVAGLEVVAADVESTSIGLDVRDLDQAAVGKPLCLAQEEGARHQPRPGMRAGHDLQASCGRNRVYRDPCADPE